MINHSPKSRLLDIEILRGFAIGFVLIQHTELNLFKNPGWLHEYFYLHVGMWSGVDLFLVISGFVIARILLPQFEACKNLNEFIKVAYHFWIRRIWRLWPASWLWLGLIFFGCVFFNQHGTFGLVSKNIDAIKSAVFCYYNFYMVTHYPINNASFPYWSLSLEEQFYFLFPFIIIIFRRYLWFFLAVGTCIQLCLWLYLSSSNLTGYLMVFRFGAIMLGILLAIFSNKALYYKLEPRFLEYTFFRILVMIALFAILATVGSNMKNIHLNIITFVSFLIVWIASYDRGYIIKNKIAKQFFIWFGSRSYAMYLSHIPIYYSTQELFFRFHQHPTKWKLLLITSILLFSLSELTYRFVETPCREFWRRRYHNKVLKNSELEYAKL